ncbi:MAG: class I SAM-dependent methyltransferase [Candidatus Rokuibacteriota bacterium]
MGGRPYEIKDDPWSSHGIMLARLGPGGGRRVLDVGAADGFLSERLAASGWRVTALERDARQAAAAGGRAHTLVVADLEQGVPALPGPFEAIVCGDVLEHLSDPLGVLRGLTGHLAPDGVVLVSVPNVAHLWIRLSLLAGRFEYTDRGILDRTHLRHFTRRTFVEMLRDAGLAVSELTATPVPLAPVVPERLHGRWLAAVQRLAAATARGWKGGLAYQFVAVCRPDGARAPEAPGAAAPARPA